MSLIIDTPAIFVGPSGSIKRALANILVKVLRALHESRRLQAERVIQQYRHLMPRDESSPRGKS